jgi:hypothetical protein
LQMTSGFLQLESTVVTSRMFELGSEINLN